MMSFEQYCEQMFLMNREERQVWGIPVIAREVYLEEQSEFLEEAYEEKKELIDL